MNWSQEKTGTKEVPYNHVTCETPIGVYRIEWKGWKEHPTCTIHIVPNLSDVESVGEGMLNAYPCDLGEAKEIAKKHLDSVLNSLIAFSNVPEIDSEHEAGPEPEPGFFEPVVQSAPIIFGQVMAERERQFAKWGDQRHSPIEWMAILTEEVGETSREALDFHFKNGDGGSLERYRDELIQAVAVGFQMLQDLYRSNPELKNKQ